MTEAQEFRPTKTIVVKTTCTATVLETWTFVVPRDYTWRDDEGGLIDRLMAASILTNVEDEVTNEVDRDIRSVETAVTWHQPPVVGAGDDDRTEPTKGTGT